MNKPKRDIWVTYHWWGWKLHFNQNGLDILNSNVHNLRRWYRYSWSFQTNFIFDFFWLLIIWIAIKIIDLKYKACSNGNKRWCDNFFTNHDHCPEIMIKELIINFWWLPLPIIPISNEVIK